MRWKKAALENCPGVPCVIIPPPPPPFITCGTSTVPDIDGNSYTTVLIGTQCWTASNLKVTKYNDGSAIPLNNTYTSGTVSTVWQGLTTGAYTIYGNESSTSANATNFGYLYNWYAVNDLRKLCPDGWHVPTYDEWTTLTTYLGGESVAGGKMKSTSSLWASPNTGADNTSGFSVLPGGYRNSDGSFIGISGIAYFWSATEVSGVFYPPGNPNAWSRFLYLINGNLNSNFFNKSFGYSVRCLRD